MTPAPRTPAAPTSAAAESAEPRPSRMRRAGRIVQGVVLGVLLVPAILQLLSLAAGISPFKYQGF